MPLLNQQQLSNLIGPMIPNSWLGVSIASAIAAATRRISDVCSETRSPLPITWNWMQLQLFESTKKITHHTGFWVAWVTMNGSDSTCAFANTIWHSWTWIKIIHGAVSTNWISQNTPSRLNPCLANYRCFLLSFCFRLHFVLMLKMPNGCPAHGVYIFKITEG